MLTPAGKAFVLINHNTVTSVYTGHLSALGRCLPYSEFSYRQTNEIQPEPAKNKIIDVYRREVFIFEMFILRECAVCCYCACDESQYLLVDHFEMMTTATTKIAEALFAHN